MPQNCKFIEKVRTAFPRFVQPRIIYRNPLRLQLPLVVKLGPRVRLHCAALGDDDGTVTMNLKTPNPKPPSPNPPTPNRLCSNRTGPLATRALKCMLRARLPRQLQAMTCDSTRDMRSIVTLNV